MDNALAECAIGRFKTERINQIGPWKSMRGVDWKTLNSRSAERDGFMAPRRSRGGMVMVNPDSGPTIIGSDFEPGAAQKLLKAASLLRHEVVDRVLGAQLGKPILRQDTC